jgi:hypothetical protein
MKEMINRETFRVSDGLFSEISSVSSVTSHLGYVKFTGVIDELRDRYQMSHASLLVVLELTGSLIPFRNLGVGFSTFFSILLSPTSFKLASHYMDLWSCFFFMKASYVTMSDTVA